jgi:hypothetical protein
MPNRNFKKNRNTAPVLDIKEDINPETLKIISE